jgi:hypothetical protein
MSVPLTGLLGVWLVMTVTSEREGSFGWVQIVLSVLFLVAFAWSYAEGGLYGVPARQIAVGLLSSQRCPGCTYKMGYLPVEADGCVLCPECGAAWRMPEGSETEPQRSE